MELPCDSTISILWIYLNESRPEYFRDPPHIYVYCTKDKLLNQSRSPITDKWKWGRFILGLQLFINE